MTIPDAILDLPLDEIATATRVTICSANPANFAGIAAVSLGSAVIDSGDFTKGNGDPSGRQLNLNGLPEITITGNFGPGTAYIALDDGSTLLATSPTDSVTLVTDEVWRVPDSIIMELTDPSYS